MSFIIGIEIITVNDSNCIIKLQAVFKSQTASRIAFQYPFRLHFYANSGRDFHCFTWFECEFCRCKEIITRTPCCCSLWQADCFVYFLCFFLRLCKCIDPVCCEAFFAYFVKFRNSFHLCFPPFTKKSRTAGPSWPRRSALLSINFPVVNSTSVSRLTV